MLFVQLVQGRERCGGVAVRWHPRPDVVRRYVKLAWWWWEPNGQLHRPLDDVAEMPFDLDALVAAPKRTGVGEDDGRWTMRWE